MAKASVDPEELRRFAKDLNRFSHELQGLMGGVMSRMRSLEATWRDQEQRKFAEEFEQTVKTIGPFVERCQEHSKFLVKKAVHVEDYFKQR